MIIKLEEIFITNIIPKNTLEGIKTIKGIEIHPQIELGFPNGFPGASLEEKKVYGIRFYGNRDSLVVDLKDLGYKLVPTEYLLGILGDKILDTLPRKYAISAIDITKEIRTQNQQRAFVSYDHNKKKLSLSQLRVVISDHWIVLVEKI